MALASFPPSFIIQSQAPSSRRSQVPGGRIRGGSADELHRTVPSPRQTNQGVWSGRFGLGSGRGELSPNKLWAAEANTGGAQGALPNPPPSPWPWGLLAASISFIQARAGL
jgi:hypothetical protein